MPHRGRSFRFARNVGLNLAGQVGVAGVSFFAIPYLVHRMGVESYGLYILMYTVAGYLSLLSFGAGTATVKYVAQFNAARDARGLHDTLRYSTWIYGLGALGGAAVLGLGAEFCAQRVFHVPQALVPTAVFVLRCAAGAAAFAAFLQFASSVMQGLQRFDWYNVVGFAQNGLMPVGAAAALALGFGLGGASLWYVALSVVVCAAALLIARRLLPRLGGAHPGPGLKFSTYGIYGLSLWLGSLAWIVTFQFDKIFLARGVSLAGLTLYAVPAGLLQRFATLPSTIATVLVPMVSELQGADAEDSLRRIYLKSVRFLLWTVLPVYALLFALMPQFLGLWLGGEFAGASVWPARLLVLSQAFFVLTFIPNSMAAGRDKPWYLAGVAWAQAVLSVVCWKLLIPRYHLLGVALGSLIAQALPAAAYLALVHRRILRLSWERYLAEGLRAPCISAGLLLAAVFPFHAAATDWIRLILMGGGGALVFYAATWFQLHDQDRELLRRFLRGPGGKGP